MTLITVTAAGGMGKTTMFRMAMAEFPSVKMLRSFTTRPARETDLPGEYEIVSEKEWKQRLMSGEYAWNQTYADFLYATRRADVKEALESPHPYLAAIIPDRIPSIHDLARSLGSPGRIRSIYIFSPPTGVLRERMRQRGEDEASIEKRIKACQGWNSAARREPRYTGFITDRNDLDEKYSTLRSYIVSSIR